MIRRYCCTMVGLVSVVCGVVRAEDAQRPNIVFLFADDLGHGDLGCYGHPYARTPAIDGLAEDGTRFTQFYVTGVTCCPSRTGVMTGLHPARFRRYPAGHGFGDRVTITELLRKHGYRTGHFGKWHIGPQAESGVYGLDEYASGKGPKSNPRGRDAWLYDEAIAFIRENRDRPFYVNVWGHITHYPVDTHPALVRQFSDVVVDRRDFSKTMQHKFDECLRIGGNLDDGMRQYLGDVASLDASVGRVLKTIDELGLRERTIVVFSSDHGPAPVLLGAKKESKKFSANMLGYAGELRGGKHEQYEGGVRSPFIVRWPGHVKAGHVDRKNVVSGMDWLPTLAAIAGIEELPERLDGEDVSDIWMGAERARRKPLFWKTSSAKSAPAMRDGRWKLHLNGQRNGGVQLYDLSNDPSESRNVADRNPEVLSRLTARLKAWVAELPDGYVKIDDRKQKRRDTKR